MFVDKKSKDPEPEVSGDQLLLINRKKSKAYDTY